MDSKTEQKIREIYNDYTKEVVDLDTKAAVGAWLRPSLVGNLYRLVGETCSRDEVDEMITKIQAERSQ